jgi:hypothetical protein
VVREILLVVNQQTFDDDGGLLLSVSDFFAPFRFYLRPIDYSCQILRAELNGDGLEILLFAWVVQVQ